MRKILVELTGEEVSWYRRKVSVEVPDDFSDDELNEICSGHFDLVDDLPAWEFVDATGLFGVEDFSVEKIEDLHLDAPAHAKIIREGDGYLVVSIDP